MSRSPTLKRTLGLWDAVWMGLGSIVGTGVFVSIGIGAGLAGSQVTGAIALAAIVALCNGFSAAQLAASHPVNGGTYEFGYRYLNPWLGFTAGWLFLLAKSASAATAALGFAGYFLRVVNVNQPALLVPIALITVIILTLIVLQGVRRSNRVNVVIVSITLLSLLFFVLVGTPLIHSQNLSFVSDRASLPSFFQATALMFVAFTGYGRITTMGEEVHRPEKTIPRAIALTLFITMGLYLWVAIVGIGVSGADVLSVTATAKAAPLEVVARQFPIAGSSIVLSIGAMTAMLGVLLNLILGLSRVLMAMGRRGDMPRSVARLNVLQTTPTIAVSVMGSAIALLVLIGNVKTTWSLSAFTVLTYYALTNGAALRVDSRDRLYPRWVAALGLAFCLFLACWVEPQIWGAGLGLIAAGLAWKAAIGRWRTEPRDREL